MNWIIAIFRRSLLAIAIAASSAPFVQAQSCKPPVDCTANPGCPACLPTAYNKTMLDADKRFKDNVRRIDPNAKVEVINGTETADFAETVGFITKGEKQAYCTGVLIAPTIAITARHCFEPGVVEKGATAAFGPELKTPAQTIKLKDVAFMAPDTPPLPRGILPGSDVGLVLLEKPATAKPIKIASRTEVKANAAMRVAGYGIREDESFGIKKATARVVIATHDCKGSVRPPAASGSPQVTSDAKFYGCVEGEIVAAGRVAANRMGADTCDGDSGGPAYVASAASALQAETFEASFGNSRTYALAAVTSRAIGGMVDPRSLNFPYACGQGGIYTLIDGKVLDWVVETSGKWGVTIARPN